MTLLNCSKICFPLSNDLKIGYKKYNNLFKAYLVMSEQEWVWQHWTLGWGMLWG